MAKSRKLTTQRSPKKRKQSQMFESIDLQEWLLGLKGDSLDLR